jgi:hypothetical protein
MNILSELKDNLGHKIKKPLPLHRKLFEDNSGAYEVATAPKMCPRTNIKMPNMWTESECC